MIGEVSTEGVTLKSTYLYDGQDFTTDLLGLMCISE
jgi:hypothetical protein